MNLDAWQPLDWEQLEARFRDARGWAGRQQLLVQLARETPPFPDAWQDDDHALEGCEARVYCRREDGRWAAWSPSLLITGMLRILQAYHAHLGFAPTTAASLLEAMERTGLADRLSRSRRNGLLSVARSVAEPQDEA